MSYYNDSTSISSNIKRNKKQEVNVIKKTCDWLIQQVKDNTNVNLPCKAISNFRDSLNNFLVDSMERLHCANLRTTSPTSKLYQMAENCGIPANALLSDISIIVNPKRAYYIKKDCNNIFTKTFIY